jgi:2',3'-cyclic-nucleotide 2'-phosphodiesterase (5'-nucleotidase family)
MTKWFRAFILISLSLVLISCQGNQTEIDYVPPTFSGLKDIQYTVLDPKPNLLDGVTAFDSIDGDVTSRIVIDESQVDWNTPGIYNLIYTVTDTKDNLIGDSVLVIITERQGEIDQTPPIIYNASNVVYLIGETIPDLSSGIIAYDDQDGNLTSQVIIDDSTVDWAVPGTYQVTYSVEDSSDNFFSITVTIRVESGTPTLSSLTIYYINDTHGAIQNNGSSMGLANIANLILDEKENNPEETLFIGGGDLLQGNILSNYFYGSSMIHMFNYMTMDAFVLGNHEFDWGLPRILEYFNPETTEMKANFPLLAANVFLKGTTTYPDHIDPYTIIERANVKIGIIGLMGFGLESSIATSMVQDYVFDDPVTWAAYYANYLREEEDVDVIIAVVHGSSDSTNQALGQLSGTERIDVTFNGHSHQEYIRFESRNGVDMPVIQSGANGNYVGEVTLYLNNDQVVSGYQVRNLTASMEPRLSSPDSGMQSIISSYVAQIEPLLTEVIITSSDDYSTTELTAFMARLIRISVDADLGIHNFGGTRASLDMGEEITVATLYQIFPFDNKVKYVELLGSEIKDYANSSVYIDFASGLSLDNLEDDVYYKVATNEYVFDKVDNPFIYGLNPVDTGILIRDVLEDVLRNQSESYPSFSIDHPIVLSLVDPLWIHKDSRSPKIALTKDEFRYKNGLMIFM